MNPHDFIFIVLVKVSLFDARFQTGSRPKMYGP